MTKMYQTRDVIKHFSKFIKGNTLDLGAGNAKYSSIIKENASDYVTFDLVPGDKIDVVGDITDTKFENSVFDTIICSQVFEHIPTPWLVPKEIKRILKKQGICLITTPFMLPYHADPHDYYRYTEEGLRFLFANEGFEILESGSYGKTPTVISEMIRFTFFNPYKNKFGKLRSRVIRYLQSFLFFFERFSKSDNIYSNVYLIARKGF